MASRDRTNPLISIGATLTVLSVLGELLRPGEPWVSIALFAAATGLALTVTGVVRDIRSGSWSRH